MQAVPAAYTIAGTTSLPFAEAVERVREELAEEGFGVLTEIDVRATLRQKLGVNIDPYLILGACNPPYAHRALELEPDLGALLPCNVVVHVQDGVTRVSAVDPVAMLSIVDNSELGAIADEVRSRVERAVEKVCAA